jgi:hypothetical protein
MEFLVALFETFFTVLVIDPTLLVVTQDLVGFIDVEEI